MVSNLIITKEMLARRAEVQARLNHLIYNGRPEIKQIDNRQYIYVRRSEAGRKISEYVDVYNDTLFALIQTQWKERKILNKELKKIEKNLLGLGYYSTELLPKTARNLEFARVNLKYNIYDQAILEGVETTLPDTETILENGRVSGMTVSDIQKILNLKHAWDFILDNDVIQAKSDYNLLCHIASLVNENLIPQGGWIRTVPVRISGATYIPPIPIESNVKENIETILSSQKKEIDKAIELCLYCMKSQIFKDGNKRASVIFANHYLIGKGEGLIVIPANDVPEFRKLLVSYYDNKDLTSIKTFMKAKSWHRLEEESKNNSIVEKSNMIDEIQASNNKNKKENLQNSNKSILNTEEKKLRIEEFDPKNSKDSIKDYLKKKKLEVVDKKQKSKTNNKKQINMKK